MASHGGIIGLVLFTLWFARRHKLSWTGIGDSLCVVACVGLFLVRCANFVNGELYGKPAGEPAEAASVSWAMLFPAFTFLAKGLSDLLKSRKMESSRSAGAPMTGNLTGNTVEMRSLPSTQPDYIHSDPKYKTGDLVPPSVTDNTTRHLEISTESETMTLPKK